jgi:hypothetical protein
VFLDENVDLALSVALTGCEVESVRSLGLSGISNGELLARIEMDFDVFISHDKGLVHQQQWSDRDLACIVIDSRSTRATSYIEGRQALVDAINGASPGTVTVLKI